MLILAAFVAPLMAFVGAAILMRRKYGRITIAAAGCAVVAALFSAAAVYVVVTRSPYWTDRTQIAGIAIEGAPPAEPLIVGGPSESARIGWPAAGFWPQLTATPLDND